MNSQPHPTNHKSVFQHKQPASACGLLEAILEANSQHQPRLQFFFENSCRSKGLRQVTAELDVP